MAFLPALIPAPCADAPLLGPEDFDALADALAAMRADDEETTQWEFCEGFLAALVCTRRALAPTEYWPVLLGDGFVPAQHMEFVWRWKRRWREIELGLDAEVESLDDARAWQPEVLDLQGAIAALPESERPDLKSQPVLSFAQLWALGFLFVVETWAEEWVPPRDKEAAQRLEAALHAIAVLAEADRGRPALSMYSDNGRASVSRARADAFGAAVWAVYDLRRLWRCLGPRVEAARRPAAPGRNEPCSCGSGKKYKKCHGAD